MKKIKTFFKEGKAWLALLGVVLLVAVVGVLVIVNKNNAGNTNVIDVTDDPDIIAEIDDPEEEEEFEEEPVPLGGDTTTIKDFGAKGDGKTDDSGALIKYIKSGATTLVFPKGTYNLSHVQIDLPKYISIVGESAENTKLLNININAPYGLSLSNLYCDTGTDRTIKCQGSKLLTGNVMFNVMPVGAQNVSYFSCVFANCDYASVAKHSVSGSPNKLMSNIILDCKFVNIGYVAVFHCLDIDYGFYSRNTFDKIGSDKILTGEVGALKLGDTSNNSTCGLKEGIISDNVFSNMSSGDDISNEKHSMACNFITVQGTTVSIDHNTFTNLLGYGDDRESVYTKVRYLTISNNTITNGGFGEGYICNKSAQYADAFATITNNTISGEYGVGIKNYGAGVIEKNTISISKGRGGISCNSMKEATTSSLTIKGNVITIGVGTPVIGGSAISSYTPTYIIQVEKLKCPVNVANNTIKCTSGDGKFKNSIRLGSVISDISICNNDVYCELNGGIEVSSNTSCETANTNVTVRIQGNKLKCKGQLINVVFQHSKSIASTRKFYVSDNTLNPLSDTKYGIIINTGTGNADYLSFAGTTASKLFSKNVVYTNVTSVDNATKGTVSK